MHNKTHSVEHYVQIKDFKFITSFSGNLVCLIIPEKPIEITHGEDKMVYEVLRLNDLMEVKTFMINRGQILMVGFNYRSIHDIQMELIEYKVTMRHCSIPSVCSACNGSVVVHKGHYRCGNYFCKAKSITPLMLLYVQISDEIGVGRLEEFERYLENFPLYDGNAKVTNIIDYIKVFKTLGNVDIQGRVDILLKNNFGSAIFDFELKLQDRLNSGYYQTDLFNFWDLLPMAHEIAIVRITSTLNPKADNFSNLITSLPVSDTTKDDFLSNINFIKELFNELTTVS